MPVPLPVTTTVLPSNFKSPINILQTAWDVCRIIKANEVITKRLESGLDVAGNSISDLNHDWIHLEVLFMIPPAIDPDMPVKRVNSDFALMKQHLFKQLGKMLILL